MPAEYYPGEHQDIRDYQDSIYLHSNLLRIEDDLDLVEYVPTEEELKDAKSKSDLAAERLLSKHTGLVYTFARRYTRPHYGLDEDDLVQEGRLGLLEAARRYKFSRQAKFSTYAIWWIRQGITRYIENHSGSLRIPVHVQQDIRRLAKVEDELRAEGHFANQRDVADRSGLSGKHFDRAKQWSKQRHVARLESNFQLGHINGGWIDQDGESRRPYNWEERVSDQPQSLEDQVFTRMLKQIVSKLIECSEISTREQVVIELRYGLDDSDCLTYEQIGKIFNLTRERIRQIEKRGLEKLRGYRVLKVFRDLAEEYPPTYYGTPAPSWPASFSPPYKPYRVN